MNKTITLVIIAIIVASFSLYGFLLWHGNPAGLDDVILGRILGTADMALGMALAFCFGTTMGSRSKDQTIQQLSGK